MGFRRKNSCCDLQQELLSELLFALAHGAEATSTNRESLGSAVDNCLYLTNVGLPTSVGLTMGVGNVLSEDNALSTNAALCHFDTSCMRLHALMRMISLHNRIYYTIANRKMQ